MKIQTGLRMTEKTYQLLQEKATDMGVSLNSLVLMLITLGLRFLEEGVIPPAEEK